MLRRLFALAAVAVVPAVVPAVVHAQTKPKIVAATPEEAGAYGLILGSCHDCHTPNWVESKGKVGKDSLMTGRALGFKGPWGTNYSKNLRTIAARQDENHWYKVMTTADGGEGNLPMPWHNTAMLNEEDIRNMYKYIKSLGTATVERIPRGAKAGAEPTSTYIDLTVKQPAAAPADAKKPETAPTKAPTKTP
jgi:mono/diheme cytochrome c family protein